MYRFFTIAFMALTLTALPLKAELPLTHPYAELDVEAVLLDDNDSSADAVYALQAWLPLFQTRDTITYIDAALASTSSSDEEIDKAVALFGLRHKVSSDVALGAFGMAGRSASSFGNNFGAAGAGVELITNRFDFSTLFVLPTSSTRKSFTGGSEKSQKYLTSSAGLDWHPPFDLPGHMRLQADVNYAFGSGDTEQDYFFGDIELQYNREASFLGDFAPDSLLIFGIGTSFSNGTDAGHAEVDMFDTVYGKVSLRVPLTIKKLRGDIYSKDALEQKLNRSLTDSIPVFAPVSY